MKVRRVAIAIGVLNLALLVGLLSQLRPASAQDIAPVLRVRNRGCTWSRTRQRRHYSGVAGRSEIGRRNECDT
jgi:hypothetical protein